MPITIAVAERPCPEMSVTMPLVAPEKLSTCEKMVAPRMMNRIVPDTATVPVSAFIRFATVSAR